MANYWEGKYLLYIPDIDIQHKRFFFLLEKIEHVYFEKNGNLLDHLKQIKETILELEKYC